MTKRSSYSICGMCTVRCPIQVESDNGKVTFIEGNPHVPAMKGAVCPRGAALFTEQMTQHAQQPTQGGRLRAVKAAPFCPWEGGEGAVLLHCHFAFSPLLYYVVSCWKPVFFGTPEECW